MYTTPTVRASAIALSILLVGCSSLDRVNQTRKQADDDHTNVKRQFTQIASGSPVQELSTQWINPLPLNSEKPTRAIISTNYYGRDRILEPYYLPRFPIYNKIGKCIGTLTNASKLNFISLSQYVDRRTPSVLTLTPPTDLFNEKELELIFFILQPMTAKMVAKRLSLSHRTIENKLRLIYEKSGVGSLNMFREYCGNLGLDLYIPPKFVKPNVQNQKFI